MFIRYRHFIDMFISYKHAFEVFIAYKHTFEVFLAYKHAFEVFIAYKHLKSMGNVVRMSLSDIKNSQASCRHDILLRVRCFCLT